jgi:hypothetical protein
MIPHKAGKPRRKSIRAKDGDIPETFRERLEMPRKPVLEPSSRKDIAVTEAFASGAQAGATKE